MAPIPAPTMANNVKRFSGFNASWYILLNHSHPLFFPGGFGLFPFPSAPPLPGFDGGSCLNCFGGLPDAFFWSILNLPKPNHHDNFDSSELLANSNAGLPLLSEYLLINGCKLGLVSCLEDPANKKRDFLRAKHAAIFFPPLNIKLHNTLTK